MVTGTYEGPRPYIEKFAPGVVKRVRATDKYKGALLTTIPMGDTVESLERDGVKLDLHRGLAGDLPVFSLPTASRVIYLPNPINGFLEAFNLDEEKSLSERYMDDTKRGNVEQVLQALPDIPGVRWEIPSTIIATRILLNHLKSKRNKYLLPGDYVWTSDQLESNRHGSVRLVVGCFGQSTAGSNVISVRYLPNGLEEEQNKAGIFIVGFPEQLDTHQSHFRLVA